MMILFDVVGKLPWHLISVLALLLVVLQLINLIFQFRFKKGLRYIFFSCILFLFCLLLFFVLVDCSMLHYIEVHRPIEYFYQRFFFMLPWFVYFCAEGVLLVLSLLELWRNVRYRNSHPGREAVVETVNLLPAGICFCEAEGEVRLVNLKMNELSSSLTGAPLTDGKTFWEEICEKGDEREGNVFVIMRDQEVWMFSKESFSEGSEDFVQILAANMTELYHMKEELAEKNRHLQDIYAKMKLVSAGERSLRIAREVMNARTTVHNQMGNVLLTGKYYLDHPGDVDETELLRMLEYNNRFLIGEAEQSENLSDPFEHAIQVAERIGVHVTIDGEVPKAGTASESGAVREILSQAILQCAANAVRHAGGDELSVTISEERGRLKAVFTNNGEPPKKRIEETGGLAALRKTVEDAGGSMQIESSPVFVLTLLLHTGL